MGFFDFLKKKQHVDNTFHSGSPEAQAHWEKYQRFIDAKSQVLGEALGLKDHYQNAAQQQGAIQRKRILASKTPSEKGFTQLAAEITAGELEGLYKRNRKRFEEVYFNLCDMRDGLKEHYTQEGFDARREAIIAEFEARLPKKKAAIAAAEYERILTDDAEFDELSSSLELSKINHLYANDMLSDSKQASFQGNVETIKHARDTGNQLLELRLGLKRDALKGSILGDPGILLSGRTYYSQTFEKNHAEFKDGNRDDKTFGNGSHTHMIKVSIDIAQGGEKVDAKHADKSLNEYFSARQQEMTPPSRDPSKSQEMAQPEETRDKGDDAPAM